MSDSMDSQKVYETLGRAIGLQAETVLTMAVMAGTLRGVEGAAIKQSLREFVLAELEDTYKLIEKMSALGGSVTISATEVDVSSSPDEALNSLLEHEVEAVAALHAVIPHSGQEARSEALEHLLEHVIMRKQQQVDYLWHASDLDEPLSS
ncbi:MAG TPA: ferritin-like domain-containing protein [Nocardioidaceae bacterium]|nr:ferritin-like domain-containing protein [Nocardioidaceae bacterium]